MVLTVFAPEIAMISRIRRDSLSGFFRYIVNNMSCRHGTFTRICFDVVVAVVIVLGNRKLCGTVGIITVR